MKYENNQLQSQTNNHKYLVINRFSFLTKKITLFHIFKWFKPLHIETRWSRLSYVQGKKPRWNATTSSVSNLHYYNYDCLFSVLDLRLHELDVRLYEENTELWAPHHHLQFLMWKNIKDGWILPKWFCRCAGNGGVISASELC